MDDPTVAQDVSVRAVVAVATRPPCAAGQRSSPFLRGPAGARIAHQYGVVVAAREKVGEVRVGLVDCHTGELLRHALCRDDVRRVGTEESVRTAYHTCEGEDAADRRPADSTACRPTRPIVQPTEQTHRQLQRQGAAVSRPVVAQLATGSGGRAQAADGRQPQQHQRCCRRRSISRLAWCERQPLIITLLAVQSCTVYGYLVNFA